MKTVDPYAMTINGSSGLPTTLTIAGRLDVGRVQLFLADVQRLFDKNLPSQLTVDMTHLTGIDSAGALALVQLEGRARECSLPFAYSGMSEEVRSILGLIDREALTLPPIHSEKTEARFFERVGDKSADLAGDFASVMTFLGGLLTALGFAVLHPRSVRWGDTTYYMRRAGAEALPIVGLISLLIGLIMAFMSSLQLKQFGANIYVASLVSISIVKELGPMMTAIIVAGRSGSAFAAEIGTMMVNEEVDALVTMGFEPIRFLAVPKVVAAAVVVPLLTLYSMMFGILGGLFVGVVGLDLTLYTYLQQTFTSIELWDVTTSLVKSGVFAVLIAGIGCQRGFQVSRGAEAVGEATTSAVVSAIFLIIVADSIFAILLHYF